VRAAALRHTDLTDFVTRTALREAEAVIAEAEQVRLSERDSLLVLFSKTRLRPTPGSVPPLQL
jgi:uncharacterized protein (DUF1778 family)